MSNRIKGILAAGGLTGIVLATALGLGLRDAFAQQSATTQVVQPPVVVEQVAAPQEFEYEEEAYEEYEEFEEYEEYEEEEYKEYEEHEEEEHDEYDD